MLGILAIALLSPQATRLDQFSEWQRYIKRVKTAPAYSVTWYGDIWVLPPESGRLGWSILPFERFLRFSFTKPEKFTIETHTTLEVWDGQQCLTGDRVSRTWTRTNQRPSTEDLELLGLPGCSKAGEARQEVIVRLKSQRPINIRDPGRKSPLMYAYDLRWIAGLRTENSNVDAPERTTYWFGPEGMPTRIEHSRRIDRRGVRVDADLEFDLRPYFRRGHFSTEMPPPGVFAHPALTR